MDSQIRLGRILGVKVGIHYSWLLIAVLITFSLAAHFETTNPNWGARTIWTLSIATALLFFASILLHELSHAAVARARDLPVRAITLFALGGVAQIEKEASDPKTEFWIGIVGPITSVLVGLVCLASAWLMGWVPTTAATVPALAMLVWLGYINISLAVFNMIPGFPLDGGRVLRAIIWWRTDNPSRSTLTAARIGQIVAFGFILFGFVRFFQGAGLGGLWLAFIGWFLMEAARESYGREKLVDELRGVRVADIMMRDCPVVDSNTDLQSFVENYLLRTGRRCFIVAQDSQMVGLVTAHEIKEVDRSRWSDTTVGEVMRTFDQLHTVAPDTPAEVALEALSRADVNQLPVVSDHHLEGIISRGQVLRYLQTRQELKRLSH